LHIINFIHAIESYFTGDLHFIKGSVYANSMNEILNDLAFTLIVLQSCYFFCMLSCRFVGFDINLDSSVSHWFLSTHTIFEKEASAYHGPKRYPYGFIVQKMAPLTWAQHLNSPQISILIRYNVLLYIAVIAVDACILWYFLISYVYLFSRAHIQCLISSEFYS
jgi:hypothetical protein